MTCSTIRARGRHRQAHRRRSGRRQAHAAADPCDEARQPRARRLCAQAIENGGRDDFPAVLQAIRASGAIEATRKAAEDEAELALNALNASLFRFQGVLGRIVKVRSRTEILIFGTLYKSRISM
jgi:hypothetical protein